MVYYLKMKKFAKDTLLLFLALRAGDIIGLCAGMWFVPKYVSAEEIGAVLPLTSFATFVSLPVFALAMTVMKETACLAADGEKGKIKTLLGGIFAVTGIAAVTVLAIAALAMAKFAKLVKIEDANAGFLVVAAAFLGCVAPVWTDALQSLKRFRQLAFIEVAGSAARFATMLVAMPVKALAGFFLAQASLPAFRMAFGMIALRKDLTEKAEPFWNKDAAKRMSRAFIAILAYQAVPMAVTAAEHFLLRTSLPSFDSAAFYMISRFSDFLYCLTYPMLLVMFPYTAMAAKRGESTGPYVIRCSAATILAASLMAGIYFFFGKELLSLLPNGGNYAQYAPYMPLLVLATSLTSCQVFFSNAEVSAGRFGFLRWLIPLHIVYIVLFHVSVRCGLTTTLHSMIVWFCAISILRFIFSAISMKKGQRDIPG